MLPKNRIAIFGGSFNPPHLGHTMVAMWLREALGYRNIHIVPVCYHNFGKKLEKFEHRIKMCELLTKKLGIKINKIEKELVYPNTTYDLITWYDQKYNRGFWHNPDRPYRFDLVIGSDIVPQLESWDSWNMLKPKLNKVIVISRPGYDTEHLVPEYKGPVVFKNLFEYYSVGISTISSSEARDLIKVGDRVNHLVGTDIENYIKKNGLYR